MTATTVTASTANKASLYRKLLKLQAAAASRPMRPRGPYVLAPAAITLATTSIDEAADKVTLLEFPDGCYLLALEITVTDMDTNVSPALVFDINKVTSAGVATTLINDSTRGQAGGKDELDVDVGALGLDVGGCLLQFQVVTAAATAAAGTIAVRAIITFESITIW